MFQHSASFWILGTHMYTVLYSVYWLASTRLLMPVPQESVTVNQLEKDAGQCQVTTDFVIGLHDCHDSETPWAHVTMLGE